MMSAEQSEKFSPYLRRAAIVSDRSQIAESQDLPQEIARRAPAVEQEEADTM